MTGDSFTVQDDETLAGSNLPQREINGMGSHLSP